MSETRYYYEKDVELDAWYVFDREWTDKKDQPVSIADCYEVEGHAQLIVNSLNEIESLRSELQRECRKVDEYEKALKEMVSIVRIHSKATKNNFAWAELEFAEKVLSTQQEGKKDE